MGIFDQINCEMPLPDGRELQDEAFQTKSLWCCMEHFTITAAGRLIHHRRNLLAVIDRTPPSPEQQADNDLDYHGDIELYGIMKDEKLAFYGVRFTHGTVEWIMPFDALRSHHRWLPYRDY